MPEVNVALQVAQLPLTVILLLAVYKLYTDAKEDREQSARERAAMLDRLESVYQRVYSVQRAVGVDDPPTLPRSTIK